MFPRTRNQRAMDTLIGHLSHTRTVSLFAIAWFCAPSGTARADDVAAPAYQTIVKADGNAFKSHNDEGASVAVVTSNRTARGGETVEQLVAELPGTAVTRYGGVGALATLSVRGSTPNQVQVYVDDIPLNLATGGGVDLGFIPVFGLQRLELFKGSSPVVFGSSGIGGVLSVATQTPENNSVHGSLGTGSWGDQRLAVSGSYVASRVRAFVAVSAMRWEGNFRYANQGLSFDPTDDVISTRSNNDLDQQDGVLRLIFPIGLGRTVSVAASLTNREQGVPGGLAARQSQQTRLALGRQTAQLVYEGRGDLGDDSHIKANLYVLRMSQGLRDRLGEVAAAPTDTHDRHWAVGNTWRVRRAFGSQYSVKSILDLRHEQFSPQDDLQQTPSGPPGTRTFAAVGLEPSVWFARSRLELTPSVRLEGSRDVLTTRDMFTSETAATDPRLSFLPVWRASAIAHPSDNVGLRFNVGHYVRAPSTTERYGNTGFILPNPTLGAERGWNTDIGARFSVEGKHGGLCADMALFASWVQDLIQYQVSQQQARAANMGAARIMGGEAAVSGTLFRHMRLFAQTTYTRAVDTSGVASREGKQLPFRPRHRAYLRPETVELPLGAGLRGGVYTDLDFTSGNYMDPANLKQIPARLLWGAGAHILHPGSGVRMIMSATNLTNASLYDLTGFPIPGRALFFTLEWSKTAIVSSTSTTLQGA